ncbi:MAG: hypothetical protein ACR2OA_15240 [Rubripirellula sp.]|jgi:hypothetical protein
MMYRVRFVLRAPSFAWIVGVLFGGALGLCGDLQGQALLAEEPTV